MLIKNGGIFMTIYKASEYINVYDSGKYAMDEGN